MTSIYKDNAQSWDTRILVLTFPSLQSSKIALSGPIFKIQRASSTNSNFPGHIDWELKGSGASKYLRIGPNFDLKEHYIPEPQ